MNHFCDIENRETKQLVPGIEARTFWANEMLMAIIDIDPGAELPNHSHPHEQVGTVLAGELILTIAGETRTLGPQDSYVIPGGVEHGGRAGSVHTRVCDVFSPVRKDYQY